MYENTYVFHYFVIPMEGRILEMCVSLNTTITFYEIDRFTLTNPLLFRVSNLKGGRKGFEG